jgi:amino acid adenylation domain-containing protein
MNTLNLEKSLAAVPQRPLSDLLTDLRQAGVQVWLDGDRLRYKAPKGALTPNLMGELRDRKAELIDFLQRITTKSEQATTIARVERQQPLPLSFTQQRLWILDQLEPESTAYNMPKAFRLAGDLHLFALERSLNEIIARHEILHTTFKSLDNQVVQVVAPPEKIVLTPQDLRDIPESEKLSQVSRLLTIEESYLFSLSQGPLIRFNLYQLADDDYILMMNAHHIIFDGWSYDLLLQELSKLYSAFSKGESSPLSPLPIQYGDFACWQRQWLESEDFQTKLRYWEKHLENSNHILELPTDYPRPAVQTHRGAALHQELPNTIRGKLLQLGQEENATLFITLLTAFKVLCYRLTNQKKITVGSPIAGRNLAEVESLIGFFVNNLVLHTDLSDDLSCRELLRRVRQISLDAYEHQEVPFEALLEAVNPQRSLSRTPLFQVWFNMLSLNQHAFELPGLDVEPLDEYADVTSKFDLTLYITESEKGISIQWVFNKDLFKEKTIQMMSCCFRTLLEQMVENPEQRIATIPLLDTPKLHYLHPPTRKVKSKIPFTEFPKTEVEQSIPARFAIQVHQHPENVAVHTRQYHWTYQELNNRANQIAQAIVLATQSSAVQRVALLMEHDAPMVSAILGVLQAGKAYVPLDPQYPAERLTYVLTDAHPAVILASHNKIQLAKQLIDDDIPIIDIDNLDSNDSLKSVKIPDVSVSPDAIAYILYTSGSTGKPKGVVQNHRNVLHFIRNHTNQLSITSADRVLLLASYSFDAAVVDIFSTLLNGATLYPFDMKIEGFLLLYSYIENNQITLYHSTPTLYRYFLKQHGLHPEKIRKQLSSIRIAVLGGEASLPQDIELYQQYFSIDCAFINLYGSTESSISLQNILTHTTDANCRIVPNGYPFDETEILLLNGDGTEAQIYGEIAVKSPYLALEYWQQPELTNSVFLADPTDNRYRIYRTGDLGRLQADGTIEFLGRRDFQVKIRGFRIELAEVEMVLESHPQVEKAIVAGYELDSDKRLVAYILTPEGWKFMSAELRQFLSDKLPDYMVPSLYIPLKSLPLTPNGKVDRKGLPEPQLANQNDESEFISPQSKLEVTLTRIWEDSLKVKPIGCEDNFFDLGGHSLLAVQLIGEIATQLNYHLPLAILFEAPSIRDLATVLQKENWAPKYSSLVPINTQGTKQPLFFHGGAADALTWQKLDKHLKTEHPFYALQRPDLNGKPLSDQSVEGLATQALEEIRTVQPEGPYYLAGHCFGGIVMFEMAQQLRNQGEKVALLVLIDSYAPSTTLPPLKVPASIYEAYKHIDKTVLWLRKNYHHYGLEKGWKVFTQEWLSILKRAHQKGQFNRQKQQAYTQYKKQSQNQAVSPAPEISPQLPYAMRFALAEKACRLASTAYVPQAYPEEVVVLRPYGILESWLYGRLQGWQQVLTGDIHMEIVPGFTGNLFNQSSLPELAQILRNHLSRKDCN